MGKLIITENGGSREESTRIAENLELVITRGEAGDPACYGMLYQLLASGGREPLASASLSSPPGSNGNVTSNLRRMLFAAVADQLTAGNGHP